MAIEFKIHLVHATDPTKPTCGQKRKGFNSPELILVDKFFDITCRQCKNVINRKWKNRNIDLLAMDKANLEFKRKAVMLIPKDPNYKPEPMIVPIKVAP